MDILLKQRLIGGIVLISLAVIFLPMLFTGGGEQEQTFESSMPAEPAYEITAPQVSMPLSLPPKELQTVPLQEPLVQEETMARTDAQPQQPAAVQPTAAVAPQATTTALQSAPTPAPSQTTPAPQTAVPITPAAPAKPEPSTVAATAAAVQRSEITGWVVQVGSFNKRDNAEQLRDKLRKMGMASFVVTGVSDKQTVYRVRIGPEIQREDAEKLQAKIQQATKLNGLVMKYP